MENRTDFKNTNEKQHFVTPHKIYAHIQTK